MASCHPGERHEQTDASFFLFFFLFSAGWYFYAKEVMEIHGIVGRHHMLLHHVAVTQVLTQVGIRRSIGFTSFYLSQLFHVHVFHLKEAAE